MMMMMKQGSYELACVILGMHLSDDDDELDVQAGSGNNAVGCSQHSGEMHTIYQRGKHHFAFGGRTICMDVEGTITL
jgi:hypothetical protein